MPEAEGEKNGSQLFTFPPARLKEEERAQLLSVNPEKYNKQSEVKIYYRRDSLQFTVNIHFIDKSICSSPFTHI